MNLKPKSQLYFLIAFAFLLFLWVLSQVKNVKKADSTEVTDRKEELGKKIEEELNRNAREYEPSLTKEPELKPLFLTPDPGVNTSTDPRMP